MARKRLTDDGRPPAVAGEISLLAERTTDDELFRKAEKLLVGGVNSPARSFNAVGGDPLLIKKGKGSKVYDYENNQYIDYVLSWGAAILGHAHPCVQAEVTRALSQGFGFGTTHRSEIHLAATIQEAIPFIKKIRFVNSGTEAVMGALRLARGFTGRDAILKFEHSYHGHADYLLAKAGSGLATLRIPTSAGVPRSFFKHTRVAPYGDRQALRRIFKKYGKELAAVIVEPVGGNFGVIEPDIFFLQELRALTSEYAVVLIFDEVITGFRFHYGAFAQKTRVTPDLICLGKIIGGCLPIGAYGGREEIMRQLSPLGKVYQASTFAGNPVVMQAGASVLAQLRNNTVGYALMNDLTERLVSSLAALAHANGIEIILNRYGSVFSLRFNKPSQFKIFYTHMRAQGVFFAPSGFEANFMSFAHTRRDIDRTISAARLAFQKL